MGKRKNIRPTVHWNITGVCGALLFVGVTWIGVSRLRDASYRAVLGDERIEVQQNTVPDDVRRWIREGNILGVNSQDTFRLQIIPEEIRVPILMYHYIEYVKDRRDTIRQSLSLSPYIFEEQVRTLAEAGYTFMTNAEVAEVLSGTLLLPSKPVVLTFDDGYRDFYTDAYPILKKYHAKATVYIITGFLNYPNNMYSWQVRQIADEGLVEIGSHTVNHAWMENLPIGRLTLEVQQSKRTLENLIGRPVISFAYPYGAFDVPVIQLLAHAGFTSAVSTIPGVDQYQTNRYFLYRLRPGGKTGNNLLSWLSGVSNSGISFVTTDRKNK